MNRLTFLVLFIPLSAIFCFGASAFAPGLVINWLQGMPLPGLQTLSGAAMAITLSVAIPAALIVVAYLRGASSSQPNLWLYLIAAVLLSFATVAAYQFKFAFNYANLLSSIGPLVALITCGIVGCKTRSKKVNSDANKV